MHNTDESLLERQSTFSCYYFFVLFVFKHFTNNNASLDNHERYFRVHLRDTLQHVFQNEHMIIDRENQMC